MASQKKDPSKKTEKGRKILAKLQKRAKESPRIAWSDWSSHTQR